MADELEPTGTSEDPVDAAARNLKASVLSRSAIPLRDRVTEAADANENYFTRERSLRPSMRASTIDLSLMERFNLTREAMFRETLLGAGEASLYDADAATVDFGNAAEVSDYLRGKRIRDRQRLWEQSTPPRNLVEHTVTIAGGLAGFMQSPESFAGPTTKWVMSGATALTRIGRASAAGGAINTVLDPAIQALRIDSGLQETYEPLQTVFSAGIGMALPGVIQGGNELVRHAFRPTVFAPEEGQPVPARMTQLEGEATGQFVPVQRVSAGIEEPKVNPEQQRAFTDYAARLRRGEPTNEADLRNAVDGGFLDLNGRITPRGFEAIRGYAPPTVPDTPPEMAPDMQGAKATPEMRDTPAQALSDEADSLVEEIRTTPAENLSPSARAVLDEAYPDSIIDLGTVPADAEQNLRDAARRVADRPQAVQTVPDNFPPTPGQRAGVFLFDPLDLQTDPKRFQFKEGGDEAGATPLLKNVTKWDPDAAGQIIVWEQRDGVRFVADGHQRVALAKRLMSSASPETLGQTIPRRLKLAPRDTANLESELANVVERIAGKRFPVVFSPTLSAAEVSAFRSAGSQTAGGMVNIFSNGDALVRLATADPAFDPFDSAAHEAFHLVESFLLNDQEYAKITSGPAMGQVRKMAEKAAGRDLTGVPDYELRAIAFAAYDTGRIRPPPILAKAFDKFREIIRAVRRVFQDRGIRDVEDIFGAASRGEFVERVPNPSRMEMDAIAPRVARGKRIANPIRVWQGTGRQWAPERIVRYADGTEDVLVGKPGQMPAVPEGAVVVEDFPFGRARIAENRGKGEGSAAYSEGLYTAEERTVADEVYRPIAARRMAGDSTVRRADILPQDPGKITKDQILLWASRYFNDESRQDPVGHSKAILQYLTFENEEKIVKQIIASSKRFNPDYSTKTIGHVRRELAKAIRYVKRGGVVEYTPRPGRLYELAIHAREDQFLDWDAPVSAQPEAVKKVLADAGIGETTNLDFAAAAFQGRQISGNDAFRQLRLIQEAKGGPSAEELLGKAGIVGTRHFDRFSREVGTGTRNYVVSPGFDDLVEVLTVGNTVRKDQGPIRITGALYRESDGFSAEDVMAIAALKNIREGSGTVMDAAKFLRLRPNEAASVSEIGRTATRQAAALTKVNENVWGMTINGVIEPRDAAVIGRLVPADSPGLQDAAANAVAKMKPASELEAEVLVRRVTNSDLVEAAGGKQEDFFGGLAPESTVAEEVRIVAKAIRALSQDKSLMQRVARNAQQIEGVGDSRIDRTAARQRADQAAQMAEIIERVSFFHGDIRDSLKALARQVMQGDSSIADAVDAFITEVRRADLLSDTGDGAKGVVTNNRGVPAEKPQAGLFGEDVAPETQTRLVPQTLGMIVNDAEPVRVDEPMFLSHGSPHKFEAFDPRYIGVGEGTQNEGIGLQFTNNRPTAYRYSGLSTGRGGYVYDVKVHATADDFIDVVADIDGLTPVQKSQLGITDETGRVGDYLKRNPGTEYLAAQRGLVGTKSQRSGISGEAATETWFTVFPGNEGRIEVVRRLDRGPVLSVNLPESDNGLVNEIRAAYAELAVGPGEWVGFDEIRPLLSGATDEQNTAFVTILRDQEATFDTFANSSDDGVKMGPRTVNAVAFEKEAVGWPPDFLEQAPPVSPTTTPDARLDQYVRELKAADADAYRSVVAKLANDKEIKKADMIAIARRVTDVADQDVPKTKNAALSLIQGRSEAEPIDVAWDQVAVFRQSGAMPHIEDALARYNELLSEIAPMVAAARQSDVYSVADVEWLRAIQAALADGQHQTQYLLGMRQPVGKGLRGAFLRGEGAVRDTPLYRPSADASLPAPSPDLLARLPAGDMAALGRLYDNLDDLAFNRTRTAVGALYARLGGDEAFVSKSDEIFREIDLADQFVEAQQAIDTLLGSENGRFYPERRERLDKLADEVAEASEDLPVRLLMGGVPTAEDIGTRLGVEPSAVPDPMKIGEMFGIPDTRALAAIGSARDTEQAVINAAAYAKKNGIAEIQMQQVQTLEYSQALRNRPIRGEIGRNPAGIPENADAPQAQRLKDISEQVQRSIGMKVRQGKIRGAGTQGTYNRNTGMTRLRALDAFEILTHEGGHNLNLDPKNVAAINDLIARHAVEVKPLAYQSAQDTGDEALIRAEGFAEWFRLFLTNPNYAQREAPNFTREMQVWLQRERPELARQLQDVQQAYYEWLTAPSQDVLVGDLVSSGKPPLMTRAIRGIVEAGGDIMSGRAPLAERLQTGQTLFSFFDRFYTWGMDRLHPINLAVRGLMDLHYRNTGQRLDLGAASDPYILQRLAVSAHQGGHVDLIHGIVPYRDVDPSGPSLAQALELAVGKNWHGNWRSDDTMAFGAYLAARRSIAEFERFRAGEVPNPPGKLTLGDYQRAVAELEAANPQFIEAAQMVHEWNANMLRKKYDAGLISKESFERLINKADYVPLQRDFSDAADQVISRGAAADNRQGVMQKYRGSLRSVINPIESMIDDAYRTASIIARNDVIGSLADLARTAGYGAGAIAEELPPNRMTSVKVDIVEALKKAGKDAGLNPDDLDDLVTAATDRLDGEQLMATLYRSSPATYEGERVVYYWRGGKRHALQLADGEFGKELFEALTGLGKEQSNWVINTLATPAAALRLGITSHPSFLLANYMRDQVSAFVLNTRFVPFVSGARGIADEITSKRVARLYAQAGGIMGGANVASLDEARISRKITALQKKGYGIRRVKDFGDVLRYSEISETGTRIALFREYFDAARGRGLSEYEAMVEGAFQARDFIDFGRHGSKMLMLRRVITFMNAAMQGTDKTARTLISDLQPLARAFRGEQLTQRDAARLQRSALAWLKIGTLTALSATYALMNKDEPEWQDAGDYMRATHWLFKIPGGQWAAIPKPFEMATILNFGERMAEGIANQDPTWADKWVRSWGHTLAIPTEPAALMTPAEVMFNYDSFRGQQIVPQWQQGLEPWQQYNTYTSEFAKMLGGAINVSPAKIDHVITGFTGSWGRDALKVTNLTAEQRRSGAAYDWPVTGRFVKSLARGSDATDKFYGLISETGGRLERRNNAYKEMINRGQEGAAQDYYDGLSDDEKVWVALNALDSADQKRVHPLRRASDVLRIYAGMRRDVTARNIKSVLTGETITLNPTMTWEINDNLARITAAEARNAMIAVGVPGWANREIIDTSPYFNAIRQLSPQVADEIEDRMFKVKALPFDGVRAVWPQVRDRLLDEGVESYLGDLRLEAMSYSGR